ncbi:MAG: DNA polymerase III subunit gamma/tau [Balneolaceae bacterium]|nr:DNA polymerase III subunit gamma/tau [Balneolaceae bacterium]
MSDNYRALTRTYRPHTFDEIVSQKHVSDTLRNAIKKNRLAHAYMFSGPRGVGKTTMARVLARAVNDIDAEVDGESLNQTLNVVEIDAASNNGVDDIRDLREKVRIPPQNGRYKIYIIDEVHMLSKAAFNALLKTLEEPPDHVIFIFATTEPHKVLPTILSRVQRFDFKRLSIEEIVDHLDKVASEEGIRIDRESLHVIAKKADGALRDALGLLDQAIAFCGSDIRHEELLRALNVVSTDRMFQFMEAVEQHDAGGGLELVNELLQEGYDIQEYLIGLTEHLRNLYVARNSAKMHLVEASEEMKKRYRGAADAFSEDDLMRMLHIVSEAQYKIREAHQPKIQFEITLLKLIHMERTQNLNALLGELEALKKKLSEQPDAPAGSDDSDGSEADRDATGNDGQDNDGSEEPSDETPETGEEKTADAPKPERPAGANGRQASAEVAVADSEPAETSEEEEENVMGKPSLGSGRNRSGGKGIASGTPAGQASGGPQRNGSSVPKRAPKDISMEDVHACWPDYLEDIGEHLPKTLHLQMQRVEPVELKNRDLVLRCSDDFARQMVDENSRPLGKILQQYLGAFLSLKCRVQRTEKEQEESESPYERFKKLQERDPAIKTLVELFGAELDYNLNP